MSFFFLGEMALIILIFVFYYVPESRDKLGIFPKDSLSQAIDKYGVEDDDDMVNLIDNIQKTVDCKTLDSCDKIDLKFIYMYAYGQQIWLW